MGSARKGEGGVGKGTEGGKEGEGWKAGCPSPTYVFEDGADRVASVGGLRVGG